MTLHSHTEDRTSSSSTNSFEFIEGRLDFGLVLICDHASNHIPESYENLGLQPEDLERHIGFDIGAAAVTRFISRELNVPAVLSRFSRLFIDPNRGLDDPTLVMRLSDGSIIPGNAEITEDEIALRIEQYYKPYHGKISGVIDQCISNGIPPALFSIHSFTDNWKGFPRPWHTTILWDKDPRFACSMIDHLRQDVSLNVGENVPYTGQLKGDCLYKHGTRRGLAHALIEIRQDLIRTDEGQKEWAQRLSNILATMFENENIRDDITKIDHFGSHSDELS